MQSSQSQSYFQQLHDYLTWQTRRIQELEQKVNALSQSVDALSKQKGVTIDRIEYHFDQLKVEQLHGTLNVGISPSGLNDKTLEDVAVGGQPIQTNTARSESFGRIQDAVLHYLREECPRELKSFYAEYKVNLGDDFCKMMIDDLWSQSRGRILHYMETLVDPNQLTLTAEQEQEITQRVIGDIQEGIRQYIQKKKDEGEAYGDITGHQ
ncbi:spore germination protein GerPC [Paenibacillus sp. P26]|nr:spore germination protein GerPC [Paenibacillus sp. P26]UUZ95931.1 spore germination protein GerPC [Paenibacillus sp. P25]